MLLNRYPATGGGVNMEFIVSFIITVAAGVACHYIIKWLDGDDKSNKSPTGCFASIKVKKNPSTVLHHGWGIRFFVHMELSYLFCLLQL